MQKKADSLPLVLTPGEPAGIGPELCVQWAQQTREMDVLAIADPELLIQRAEMLGLELEIFPYSERAGSVTRQAKRLSVLPTTLWQPAVPGQLDKGNANYVLNTLRLATRGCMEGRFAALVTGPVHKGIINESGLHFTGHTEFLAEMTGGYPVMMLACPGLRVALATTHLPLKEVSATITRELLEKVIRILHQDMIERFGISNPNILVCGLNPHAGEGGHLGDEEIETITPVLEKLRTEGMRLFGPLPADTLYTPAMLEKADATLAMYHDQGLPVLKHKGFGNAVNITLGLPIIRTSVDHGTALDIAGSGTADIGSLHAAIESARMLITGAQGIRD